MDLIGISILNYKSIKKAIYLEMPKEKGVIIYDWEIVNSEFKHYIKIKFHNYLKI